MKAVFYFIFGCLSLCLFSGCSDDGDTIVGCEFLPPVDIASPQVQFCEWRGVPEHTLQLKVADEGIEFDIYFPYAEEDFWPDFTLYLDDYYWSPAPESSEDNHLKEYAGDWGNIKLLKEDGKCMCTVYILPNWRSRSRYFMLQFKNGRAVTILNLYQVAKGETLEEDDTRNFYP